jgi:RNA polymerase sigma factor (TIGR02999 family)
MDGTSAGQVTRLLDQIRAGEARAGDELLALVYDELRAVARNRLAGMPASATLHPTSLVHEAYVKLLGASDIPWQNRVHFFAAAARAMRDIVVDHARRHAAQKRGGGRRRLSLEQVEVTLDTQAEHLIALDEALARFETTDPESAQVVNLRFFGGLSGEQTAQALGVSASTVDRLWAFSKAWLQRELAG